MRDMQWRPQLFRILTITVVVGVVIPPSATAAPLQPTKPWVLEFAEQKCVAAREYGSPGKPLVVLLKPSPIGNLLQFTLVRPAAGGTAREVSAELQIGDDPPVRLPALAFDHKAAKLRSMRISLLGETADRLSVARTITIKASGEVDQTFAISPMRDVTTTMKTCVADLRTHWNIDPDKQVKLRARATANLARFLQDRDYPEMAALRHQGGVVEFALLIDEAGKVADCTVTVPSGVPVLDAQSCAILANRAKFEPAIGNDGKPAKDSAVSRITWKIP